MLEFIRKDEYYSPPNPYLDRPYRDGDDHGCVKPESALPQVSWYLVTRRTSRSKPREAGFRVVATAEGVRLIGETPILKIADDLNTMSGILGTAVKAHRIIREKGRFPLGLELEPRLSSVFGFY